MHRSPPASTEMEKRQYLGRFEKEIRAAIKANKLEVCVIKFAHEMKKQGFYSQKTNLFDIAHGLAVLIRRMGMYRPAQ